MVEGTDEVALVNYDADYIYLIISRNVGLYANNYWIEETYLLGVGMFIFMARQRSIAKGQSIKIILTTVLIIYCLIAGKMSLGYPFILALSMTTDEIR